jgi:hypothetical protein
MAGSTPHCGSFDDAHHVDRSAQRMDEWKKLRPAWDGRPSSRSTEERRLMACKRNGERRRPEGPEVLVVTKHGAARYMILLPTDIAAKLRGRRSSSG